MSRPPPSATEVILPAQSVRSLAWEDDVLVDWAGGGGRYHLNGHQERSPFSLAYPFDAGIALPDGEYAVVYTRLNTKGLILRNGTYVREINRPYYCADAYEYPLAIFRLASGRPVIVHCPDAYNRLDIEDAETGERLTGGIDRKPDDIFHSRLVTSPDGRFLLDAGWHWHPVDTVRLFDIDAALGDPGHMDGKGLMDPPFADESHAVFDAAGRVLIGLKGDIDEETDLCEVQAWDTQGNKLSTATMTERFGAFMPVGEHFLLGLYDHPRLFERQSGFMVKAWPHIKSGGQTSSILKGRETPPPMAMDIPGRRIAIAGPDSITVLSFTDP